MIELTRDQLRQLTPEDVGRLLAQLRDEAGHIADSMAGRPQAARSGAWWRRAQRELDAAHGTLETFRQSL